MTDRKWLDWPDAPGWWWCQWREPLASDNGPRPGEWGQVLVMVHNPGAYAVAAASAGMPPERRFTPLLEQPPPCPEGKCDD